MQASESKIYQPIITSDQTAIGKPGAIVQVDPDEAEALGAFVEDALTLEEAWDANADE
jgi:hypothetical protein